MNIVESKIQNIAELCNKHNVDELYVFGSALTNKFKDSSDIDLLVQFAQVDILQYFDNYMTLKEELEKLFDRKIDLVENQTIKNPIFRQIVDRDKKLIYGRKNS